MKHYRKPAGHYIKLEDSVPVSETLIEVCERPSENHVFANIWITDETARTFNPMNSAVCWRLKTAQELDAEKTETAMKMADIKLVAACLLEAVFDMKANPANYPTAASLKQKALELYKARL